MDPRVLDHFDGDMRRANISPRRRARVLGAHGMDDLQAAPALEPATSASAAESAGSADQARGVRGARCPGCGYVYDEARGDPREGFPAGTPWADVPATWCCPDCGVREKVDFVLIQRTTA